MQQRHEAFAEYLKIAEPKDCPLFKELLPNILADRGRGDAMVQRGMGGRGVGDLRE
jgi:hypothetical protein